jgi:hypothetical protein
MSHVKPTTDCNMPLGVHLAIFQATDPDMQALENKIR